MTALPLSPTCLLAVSILLSERVRCWKEMVLESSDFQNAHMACADRQKRLMTMRAPATQSHAIAPAHVRTSSASLCSRMTMRCLR